MVGLLAALCLLLFGPAARAAAATTTLPPGALKCASAETGTCTIPAGASASVYYGAGTSFLVKTAVTGSIGCNQTAFGGDPDYGVVKACYVIANVLPAAAVLCAAAESGTCSIPSGATATVYYGAGSSFIYFTGVTGQMACNQTAFGGNPDPAVAAACYAFINALPAGTVHCSGELGTCTLPANVSATVYYGAGSRYSYQQGVTGSLGCNPTSFGGDPDNGIVKACYAVVNTLPPGAVQCAAAEAGTCTVPAGASVTIFYGANGNFLYKQAVTGSIGCNQSAFGGDPDYGVVKGCYDLVWLPVNLAPYFNVPAISSDTGRHGTVIYNQGGATFTYSATALGATVTWNGSTFTFGAADVNDAVSNTTIALPTGSFGRLDVLASRTYGSNVAETFVVTYSDGTQSTFTRGMSDWWHNTSGTANFPGESTVAYPSYIHNGAQGASYQEPASVYGYTFALNSAKVVKSVKLPADPFVGVLAMNLGPAATAPTIPAAGAAQAVLTQHNDTWRTGMNAAEYQLTPATVGNVSGTQVFGRLGSIALDESVDAQPLVVPNISVVGDPNAGTHDVVYVATEANTVYAIDPVHLSVLTTRNLGAAVANPVGSGITYVGITSTPVIDTSSGVMYVVAYVQAATGPQYQLHMLSLSSLADVVPPVTIAATATLNNSSAFPFNATYQRQRPSLLETGGFILVAFGSFGDLYANLSRGWILTYNAATLALNTSGVDVLDKLGTSADGVFLSSVWMSGSGPAADENGAVYFSTGNSDPGSYDGADDIQESVVKINPQNAQLLSLYTPEAVETYDIDDTDVGSGGVLLLPNPNKRVGAILSKDGLLRVFNRDNLGGENDAALVATFNADPCWCSLSYFNDGQDRLVSSGNETLRVLAWQTGSYAGLIQQGTGQMPGGQSPGAVTSISSGGTNNAIIWVVPRPLAWNTPGVNLNLMAFQATPVNGILPLLYLAPAGSWFYGAQGGGESNNAPPTVANGRVYVGSYQQLTIFGFGGQR